MPGKHPYPILFPSTGGHSGPLIPGSEEGGLAAIFQTIPSCEWIDWFEVDLHKGHHFLIHDESFEVLRNPWMLGLTHQRRVYRDESA